MLVKMYLRSKCFGGFTNFWGGGMYPFTKDDLMKVKIKYSEILPYYQIISNEIGIVVK